MTHQKAPVTSAKAAPLPNAFEKRISPTREDNAIHQRNLRRVANWDRAIHPPLPNGQIVGSNLLGAMMRACSDYLEFPPL